MSSQATSQFYSRSFLKFSRRTTRPAMQSRWKICALTDKIVWIKSSDKTCITTAMETSLTSTVLIDDGDSLEALKALGRLTAVTARADGSLIDESGSQIGRISRLACSADLATAQAEAVNAADEIIVMAPATDTWKIIPAENLVAAFQATPATLLAVATSAAEGAVMLEALEVGTDGVVLDTTDPWEVRAMAAFMEQRAAQSREKSSYQECTVSRVLPVASGDRACVDLCSAMVPGEGLLVGSFARGLFLVHSECEDSGYINSRPFRVNAGPVHAYVQGTGGRTKYLSELRSGDEVEIFDAEGRRRPALVGRVKIEKRPLVLVEATLTGSFQSSAEETVSILLQNAETVKLVGPQKYGSSGGGNSGKEKSWRAISVSDLAAGDKVYVLLQGGARHTGVKIEESITER